MFCFCAALLATPVIIPNPDEKIKPFFQKKQTFFENDDFAHFLIRQKPGGYGGRLRNFVVYYIG